jgi:hypothetical protein
MGCCPLAPAFVDPRNICHIVIGSVRIDRCYIERFNYLIVAVSVIVTPVILHHASRQQFPCLIGQVNVWTITGCGHIFHRSDCNTSWYFQSKLRGNLGEHHPWRGRLHSFVLSPIRKLICRNNETEANPLRTPRQWLALP